MHRSGEVERASLSPVEPSESNAFARAIAGKAPPGRVGRGARFALGVALSLILAGCFTIAVFLLGAVFVRGVRRGDPLTIGAGVAVIAMTVVMARGRRKR